MKVCISLIFLSLFNYLFIYLFIYSFILWLIRYFKLTKPVTFFAALQRQSTIISAVFIYS